MFKGFAAWAPPGSKTKLNHEDRVEFAMNSAHHQIVAESALVCDTKELVAGKHKFDFSFNVPKDTPSTFSVDSNNLAGVFFYVVCTGIWGAHRYKASRAFPVHVPVGARIKTPPGDWRPQEAIASKRAALRAGKLTCRLRTARAVFSAGDQCECEVTVKNESFRQLRRVALKLRQVVIGRPLSDATDSEPTKGSVGDESAHMSEMKSVTLMKVPITELSPLHGHTEKRVVFKFRLPDNLTPSLSTPCLSLSYAVCCVMYGTFNTAKLEAHVTIKVVPRAVDEDDRDALLLTMVNQTRAMKHAVSGGAADDSHREEGDDDDDDDDDDAKEAVLHEHKGTRSRAPERSWFNTISLTHGRVTSMLSDEELSAASAPRNASVRNLPVTQDDNAMSLAGQRARIATDADSDSRRRLMSWQENESDSRRHEREKSGDFKPIEMDVEKETNEESVFVNAPLSASIVRQKSVSDAPPTYDSRGNVL